MATNQSESSSQKALVDSLRAEWKLMWSQRYNDKPKAEGISVSDYKLLQVDRGTVIHATKDFKPLNFKEILEQNQVEPRYIQPNVEVGGWKKFAKTKILNQNNSRRSAELPFKTKKECANQPKKSGRGWLHKQ